MRPLVIALVVAALVVAIAGAKQPFFGVTSLRRLFGKTPPLNPEEYQRLTCDECNGTGSVLTTDRKRVRVSRLGKARSGCGHGPGTDGRGSRFRSTFAA